MEDSFNESSAFLVLPVLYTTLHRIDPKPVYVFQQ